MSRHSPLLALGFVVCFLGRPDSAQAQFKDALCPGATQYVITVGKLTKDAAPQKIYDAAQAAADAYQRCSKDKLADGLREPQHYADTRGAGFAVLASRALIAMNREDDARRVLAFWRPLVQQVVDWQSETTAFQSGNANGSTTTVASDHRPSVYRDAAKDVVAAIDTELARLGPAPARTP